MAEAGIQQKSCCPPGSHGPSSDADYVPRGEVRAIERNGVKCEIYVVLPPEEQRADGKALLFLHDIFGVDSGRTKQICDDYAAKGFFVVLPDLFEKEALSDKWASGWRMIFALGPLLSFIRSAKWPPIEKKLDAIVFPMLRNEFDAKSIGLVCYCWGMFPMLKILERHETGIKCGVGFHPALNALMVNGAGRGVIKNVEVPIAVFAAGADPGDIKQGGLADKAMRNKPFYNDCVFKEFKAMKHGWVNRGPLSNAKVKRDFELAISDADEFLSKHL